MFRVSIDSTPFATRAADGFFRNINGENYKGDISFLSTLRALVAPRIKDNECTHVYFRNSSYNLGDIAMYGPRRIIGALSYPANYPYGALIIHDINGSVEANDKCFDILEKHFIEYVDDFKRVDKVTDFFRKTFRAICFVNEEKRQVSLYVENLNMRRMHYLQCAIFALLPWYFNPKEGVSSDEMELIQSLREVEPDKYMAAINKLAEGYDFRSMYIKNALAGFETLYEQREIQRASERIARTIATIRSYQDEIAAQLRIKRDEELKLLGLETKVASAGEESEIMEYFLCNKKLVLDHVNNTELVFAIKDYLTYFDEEMAKRVIDNPKSYIYQPDGRYATNIIPEHEIKVLMNELFIEQSLKIKMCSAYSLVLGECVRGRERYPYNDEFDGYTPNPHIDMYSCLGSYAMTINERLQENDTIGAIEQCIASCKSLNFADSVVMNGFMLRIYGLNCKPARCIELPNGDVVDAKGAIEWLKEIGKITSNDEASEE